MFNLSQYYMKQPLAFLINLAQSRFLKRRRSSDGEFPLKIGERPPHPTFECLADLNRNLTRTLKTHILSHFQTSHHASSPSSSSSSSSSLPPVEFHVLLIGLPPHHSYAGHLFLLLCDLSIGLNTLFFPLSPSLVFS